jgi:hypothetical protein
VVDVLRDHGIREVAQAEAAAAAAAADLAAQFAGHRLLGDHGDVQAHQRAHVGSACAVGARYQHHVVLGADAGHHLHHAGVFRGGELFHLLEQRHLLRAVEGADRIRRCVEQPALRHLGRARQLDAAVLARGGDGAHGARGVHQGFGGEVVAVGEGRLLTGHRAHAHALVDAEGAALDDAFLEAPALVARGLEVQVGVVDAVLADQRQRLRQRGLGQAEGLQHQLLGHGKALECGFAGDHRHGLLAWSLHRRCEALAHSTDARSCSNGRPTEG